MARLWERYKQEIQPQLMSELGISNPLAVPRLEKVVVSAGTGSPASDKTRLGVVMEDLARITGQKPQMRRAQKAVSNFKLRKGMEVGCRVTLRGRRMYEFVDRLINVAVPRLRDFRGLNPQSFDGRGNYSMGLPDQLVFPEIDAAKVTVNQGMNITFVTTARTDAQARRLLARLGMPFRTMEG
ncbi:MAG TPA: 50S ribosomal protein L5 [Phycisphaerae bacterium]|nr:50S ribosomal protein L5 [Phycisphaerae bacterium]HNU44465.1 50S ribosomal protein L5 [Phycisphaerae bacterium]